MCTEIAILPKFWYPRIPIHDVTAASDVIFIAVTAANVVSYLNTVRSRFATVRFTIIHLYEPCWVGPSTPDLWCITIITQRPFFTQCTSSSFPVCMCFFCFYFSTVLWSLFWFFQPWRPSKRQKKEKTETVDVTFFLDVFWTTAWFGLLQQNKKWFDWYFSNYLCNFYIPNSLN